MCGFVPREILCIDKLSRSGHLSSLGDLPQVSCSCLFVAVWSVFLASYLLSALGGKKINNPTCSVTNWLKSVGLNVSFLFPSCPDARLFSYKCISPVFPIGIATFSVLFSADYQHRIYDSLTQIMFPLAISEEILFHNGLLSLQKTYITPWNSPAPARPTEEQINSYLLRSP